MPGRLNGQVDPRCETRGSTVHWRVSNMVYTSTLRPGLRVRFLPDPSGGRYVLDELPVEEFPKGSVIRHDAEHYGVPLAQDDLQLRS